MKIERHLNPNCSDYTISLYDLSEFSIDKIKELEKDWDAYKTWQTESHNKLPKEPDDFTDACWSKWHDSEEVKAWLKECDQKSDELRKKYKVMVTHEEANTETEEDIFDTDIRSFNWISSNTLDIYGYLNEENFVQWLNKVAKVTTMIVRGG